LGKNKMLKSSASFELAKTWTDTSVLGRKHIYH
jgi:hypothetical protein